jgi:glycosyltransferase involved in cell wall biosynthesis
LQPKLSILMPVYDEAATVEEAVNNVLAADLGVPFELIVVDDGSSDGSGSILDRIAGERFTLIRHTSNEGKGAAVRRALRHAQGELSAIFDADLEYDPSDLATLLPPLEEGLTRAVFGVRAFDGYTSHSFAYVMGNKTVTLAANVLFNVYLHDLMTCQKVIRTDLFRSLPLRARGFDIEAEITARLIQAGERIYELPVQYKARSTEEGKKLTAADGVRVLGALVRCRFTSG